MKYEKRAKKEEKEAVEAREQTKQAMALAIEQQQQQAQELKERIVNVQNQMELEKQEEIDKTNKETEIANKRQLSRAKLAHPQHMGDDNSTPALSTPLTAEHDPQQQESGNKGEESAKSADIESKTTKDQILSSMLPAGPPPPSSHRHAFETSTPPTSSSAVSPLNSRQSKLEERRRRSMLKKTQEGSTSLLVEEPEQKVPIDGTIANTDIHFVHQITSPGAKISLLLVVPSVAEDVLRAAIDTHDKQWDKQHLVAVHRNKNATTEAEAQKWDQERKQHDHQYQVVGKIMSLSELAMYQAMSSTLQFTPTVLGSRTTHNSSRNTTINTINTTTTTTTTTTATTAESAAATTLQALLVASPVAAGICFDLLHFTPRMYGTWEQGGQTYSVLSDVCAELASPCVLDICLCRSKGSSSILGSGLSVTGYRTFSSSTRTYTEATAEDLDAATVSTLLEQFYRPSDRELGLGMVRPQMQKLTALRRLLQRWLVASTKSGQGVHLGEGVSILLTYDGEDRDLGGNVWLVDFDGCKVVALDNQDTADTNATATAVTDGEALEAVSSVQATASHNNDLSHAISSLTALIAVLSQVEQRLRLRAGRMLEERFEEKQTSKAYACRVLFELMDCDRCGVVTFRQLLRRFAVDNVVRWTYFVIRKKWSSGSGDLFAPSAIRKTFEKIVERGDAGGAVGGFGSSESSTAGFTQDELFQFLF